MMKYKDYQSKIEYDDDARIFHGEVIGLRDVITFQGACVNELEQSFHDSVDDYLDFCMERGEKPEKPYSGKFILRLEPELHQRIAMQAKKENKSINKWIGETLHHVIH